MTAPQRTTLDPDPRSAGFATATYENLLATASRWTVLPGVPEHISVMLRVARDLFVHGRFVYEFFSVAVVWSLLALEAGLKDRLGQPASRAGLRRLIDQAEARSLLDAQNADKLRAASGLRNTFAHPMGQVVLTPGMAAELLEATHRQINRLYTD